MVFNPEMFESIETIHGLVMLAIWPSSQGDGRMLMSMAVNIATNMQLNKAAARVAEMRKIDSVVISDELMERAKLVSVTVIISWPIITKSCHSGLL